MYCWLFGFKITSIWVISLQCNYSFKPRPQSTFFTVVVFFQTSSQWKWLNWVSNTWLKFVFHFDLTVGSKKTSDQWKIQSDMSQVLACNVINSVCRSIFFIYLQIENRNLKKEMSKRSKEKPLTTSGWV